jgi:hypothetical protein
LVPEKTGNLQMGRIAKVLKRKENGPEPDWPAQLDLARLQQTPGFMIRILQLAEFRGVLSAFRSAQAVAGGIRHPGRRCATTRR